MEQTMIQALEIKIVQNRARNELMRPIQTILNTQNCKYSYFGHTEKNCCPRAFIQGIQFLELKLLSKHIFPQGQPLLLQLLIQDSQLFFFRAVDRSQAIMFRSLKEMIPSHRVKEKAERGLSLVDVIRNENLHFYHICRYLIKWSKFSREESQSKTGVKGSQGRQGYEKNDWSSKVQKDNHDDLRQNSMCRWRTIQQPTDAKEDPKYFLNCKTFPVRAQISPRAYL